MPAIPCSCGCVWFEVQPFVGTGVKGLGAVLVDKDGKIVGYSGLFVCIECGVVAPVGEAGDKPRLAVVP